MDNATLKSGKVIKVVCMMLLISASLLFGAQANGYSHWSKSLLTCDGEMPDTIISAPERFRERVHFEALNKMTVMTHAIRACGGLFQFVNPLASESLFINAYQRNVFYIYAFSTVP
jgi:hypothetical protein